MWAARGRTFLTSSLTKRQRLARKPPELLRLEPSSEVRNWTLVSSAAQEPGRQRLGSRVWFLHPHKVGGSFSLLLYSLRDSRSVSMLCIASRSDVFWLFEVNDILARDTSPAVVTFFFFCVSLSFILGLFAVNTRRGVAGLLHTVTRGGTR